MRRACALILPALLALAAGCDKPRARIHGKVTYKSRPLGGAMVSFMATDNQVYRTTTRTDGSYDISGVPPTAPTRTRDRTRRRASGASATTPRNGGSSSPRR